MDQALPPTAREVYRRQGFVTGLRALSDAETATCLSQLAARIHRAEQSAGGRWWPRDHRPHLSADHPLQAWARHWATRPAVLAHVRALLGPDLLIRNVDLFVKAPGQRRAVAWHVDSHIPSDRWLTAWIPLTPALAHTGPLELMAGSHRQQLSPAPDSPATLTLKPEAVERLSSLQRHLNVQPAGTMSLHHPSTVHRSGPNLSDQLRVALVVRFLAADVTPEEALSGVCAAVDGARPTHRMTVRDQFAMTWSGPEGSWHALAPSDG